MKISFISTVYNEEKTVGKLLESILKQTKKPGEVIIVDGGSKDRTASKVNEFKNKFSRLRIGFKLIIKKGNRSVGRNEAIKNSSGNIIITSDSGCILERNWIKSITDPFYDERVDVVSGFYKPVAKNVFQKSLATYTSVMKDKVDEKSFLPSSRSVAFRKNAWQKVRGYPEELDTCEDLVFSKKLREKGLKFVFAGNAVVFWPQRKNLLTAFKQFFNYAVGDGRALFFRSYTPLLYARYIFGLYFLILVFLYRSKVGLIVIFLLLIAYIIWSVKKNYRYVKDRRAYFQLPLLQFASDIAVLLGTTYGVILYSLNCNVLNYIKKNFLLFLLLIIYVSIEIITLQYGIPNQNHPFPYHMDEWHQLNSVRAVAAYGTPNIEGAAHGTMFHFFLSALFLAPFSISGYINPVTIDLADYINRMRIFELLRLNSIIYGVLSIFFLYKIAKNTGASKIVTTVLFTLTPIWLLLSGYFKYDIALTFWIIISMYFITRFAKGGSKNSYIIAAVPAALAFAVKVSALPLLPIYILSFFIFSSARRKDVKYLIYGVILYLFIAVFFGLPDMVFGKGNIYEYLFYNLITGPSLTQSIIIPMDTNVYLFSKHFPTIYGYGFVAAVIASFIFFAFTFYKNGFRKYFKEYKMEIFMISSFFIFMASLVSLGIYAAGNRSLVVLPFAALIAGFAYNRSLRTKSLKKIVIPIFAVVVLLQIYQCFAWIYVKKNQVPQESASSWILANLPKGSVIGLENIPIYQYVPDIIQKEFYLDQYSIPNNNKYIYQMIDEASSEFPDFVVITNGKMDSQVVPASPKKGLLKRLESNRFKEIAVFKPDLKYFYLFGNDLDYYLSGLMVASPLTTVIYQRTR